MLASFGVYLALFGHRFTMKLWNVVGATQNFTVKEKKTLKTVLILLQLISWEETSLSSVQGQYGCRGGLCYWVLELSRVSPGEMQHWCNEERGPWQDIKSSRGTNGRVGDREREREDKNKKKKEYITTSCPLLYCLLTCSPDTAIKIPLSCLTFIFSPPRPINTACIRHLKQALSVEESNMYVCEMQRGMHNSCPIKKGRWEQSQKKRWTVPRYLRLFRHHCCRLRFQHEVSWFTSQDVKWFLQLWKKKRVEVWFTLVFVLFQSYLCGCIYMLQNQNEIKIVHANLN